MLISCIIPPERKFFHGRFPQRVIFFLLWRKLSQTLPKEARSSYGKHQAGAVRPSGRAGPPTIIGHGSAAGYKESQGPLGRHFDHTCKDDTFGEKSWEMAESQMQQLALGPPP